MANINLQASLLSRFDCLFIMLDTIDVDSDRKIADHVVRMHRYRNPQEQDGQVLSIAADAEVLTTKDLNEHTQDEGETPIYEKYDALLHGNSRKKTDKIVSVQFMKKYVHIAKCIKPVLSEAACEILADEYANLRSDDFEDGVARTQTVTARALETLIRLSTAHAKARLSKTVDVEDAELAIELVQFAYFKKVLNKPKKRRHASGEDGEEGEEAGEDEAAASDTENDQNVDNSGGDATSTAASKDSSSKAPSPKRARKEPTPDKGTPVEVSQSRLEDFMSELFAVFEKDRSQVLSMDKVRSEIVGGKRGFTQDELSVCIDKMTEMNKVMQAANELYLI